MTPTEQLLRVHVALDRMHSWRGWAWWPDAGPFAVIVGAVLVQNTAWTNVEKALAELTAAGITDIDGLAAVPLDELETLIRPSGQFRQKARKLRACVDLVERHGGLEALLRLPGAELRAALLSTWGIGPETADCIVLYASKQPSFVIDAYTKRVFSRLGLGPGEKASYERWQTFFEASLPRDGGLWATYHSLIVLHAKHLCLKNRPRCGACG